MVANVVLVVGDVPVSSLTGWTTPGLAGPSVPMHRAHRRALAMVVGPEACKRRIDITLMALNGVVQPVDQ